MLHSSHSISLDLSLTYQENVTERPDVKVAFNIPLKGISVIFGPSGSGKTSLLRCIAGLEKKAIGELHINGQPWQTVNHFTPPHLRSVGYVFQQPSLFPHLTVKQNIHYGIKRAQQKITSNELEALVSLFGLTSYLNKYPNQLSLGEQQRVAIVRALAIKPEMLLMDEPLASLDIQRKQEILAYLQTLQDKHPIPIIYVTHSTEEVLALASHLILLNQGRVTEHGTIAQIFPRLSQETKLTNQIFIQGITTQYNAQYQTYQITSGEDKLDFPAPAHHPIALNSSITLMIDARHIILSKTSLQDSTGANSLMGSITDLKAFTCNHLHTVTINTISNSVEIPVHNHVMQCLELQIGDQVYLNINPLNLHPIRDKS